MRIRGLCGIDGKFFRKSGTGILRVKGIACRTRQRKAETTKSIGDRAESVVADRLESDGHEIIARNWRTKWCEIDVVSKKGDTIYFTEVKYRKNANHGGGIVAVTPKKLRQMKFAADYFALKHPMTDMDMQLMAAEVHGEDFAITSLIEIA